MGIASLKQRVGRLERKLKTKERRASDCVGELEAEVARQKQKRANERERSRMREAQLLAEVAHLRTELLAVLRGATGTEQGD